MKIIDGSSVAPYLLTLADIQPGEPFKFTKGSASTATDVNQGIFIKTIAISGVTAVRLSDGFLRIAPLNSAVVRLNAETKVSDGV